jgi:hypothetical protein
MLKGLADGETDAAVLAALADQRLCATPEELRSPGAPVGAVKIKMYPVEMEQAPSVAIFTLTL